MKIIMKLPDNVILRKGARAGATVAIFCGVHGNEQAGIRVVEKLVQELEVSAGTVYLVYANPHAVKLGVRLVNANLNRLFVRRLIHDPSYEHHRAAELMDLLDGCDALLDLHSYPAPRSPEQAIPFAICEPPHHAIASLFDVPIVVSGFTAAEGGGSDGYMHTNGKTGVCVELGANEAPELFVGLGLEIARSFLARFGCIEHVPIVPHHDQKHLILTEFHKKTHADFHFVREFQCFDLLMAGDLIATENGRTLRADEDAYIIFPNGDRPVGIEAFLLARGARPN